MATQQEIAGKGHSNTPKLFQYILSSEGYGVLPLTNVPEGWEGSELTFIRDKKYKGVLTEFSTNELKFVKEGRDYIQTAYEAKGVDYEITITIKLQNNSTFQYETYFIGKIDLATYKIDSTGVSTQITSSGFQDTILNRQALKVDLLNTKYIGGGERSMEQLTNVPMATTLNGYTAAKNADWASLFNESGTDVYPGFLQMSNFYNDFDASEISDQTPVQPVAFFQANQDHTLDFNFELTLNVSNESGVAEYRIDIFLKKNGSIINQWADFASADNTFNFNESVAGISLVSGDDLSLEYEFSANSVFTYDYTGSVGISETLGSSLPQIVIDSFLSFEFMARIIQLISGIANPLESTFLGRTDSIPVSYGSDGDGSLVSMTKGQFIREFPLTSTGEVIQTFNASLSDAFKDINGRENIGLGFEVRSGSNKVVIERERYFFDISDNPNYPATETEKYQTNQILDFSDVVTEEILEKEVLPAWYANEISSGYSKFDYEIVQGLKEFNTKSNYATPLKAIESRLDLTSPFRFDTQGANKLREKPYQANATEDVSGDNDVFGFDVKRESGDFTAKTNEDFIAVTGGIDPEQSYNLNFTPRRNLEKHDNRIRSMGFAIGDEVQWLETDKNSKLKTKKIGETSLKSENGDIIIDDLDLGYWIPEAYVFEAPVDAVTISAIQANPYGVIKIASDKYGWILEVQTNNEDNKGQFKLLRVNVKTDSNENGTVKIIV